MATRFYFVTGVTPSISPAFDTTAWNGRTDEAERRVLGKDIAGNSGSNDVDSFGAATAPVFNLSRQYIFEGLAAQTLSGTVKGQIRCYENQASNNATLALRIAVCAADGTDVQEALAISASDATTTPPEFSSATGANRPFQNASEQTLLTLNSVNIPEGGALIVEVGWRQGTGGTSRKVEILYGEPGGPGNDLPEDTTTNTGLNPWIEFSHDFILSTGGGPASTRGQLSYAELEAPSVPTRGRVAHVELEAPLAPARGRLSQAELETPNAPTVGRLSAAELEAPLIATKGQLSFAELEAPLALTRGRLAHAEFETPYAPARVLFSHAEFEAPDSISPTKGLLSHAELEAPSVITAGRLTHAEFEVPNLPTKGRVSAAYLEAPFLKTKGLLGFAEMEAPLTPTRGLLAFAELEVGTAPAAGRLSQVFAAFPEEGEILVKQYSHRDDLRTRRRKPEIIRLHK